MTDEQRAELSRASAQDGRHPRPQLLRAQWVELSGEWGFDHDDDDVGLAERWQGDHRSTRSIVVPYPPESPASGIADTGFHPIVWYRRELTKADLEASGLGTQGDRLHLRFGAVDYRASVWLNGVLLGHHEGGHVPFGFDATDALDLSRETQTVVVRAEDDPHDVGQPRGKQDWQEHPHVIWYHRTSGIWQPVWLEAVPRVAIDHIAWVAESPGQSIGLTVRLSRRPTHPMTVRIELDHEGEILSELSIAVREDRFTVEIPIARQQNGQNFEGLLWSPEHPRLIDARIELLDGATKADVATSYLGVRSVAANHGAFVLNNRPYQVRGVLEQGYWPQSHLAAPSAEALKAEIELIRELGFNTVRMHQKIEDPRFLFWADRLGVLVWAETPSAFEFSPTAVRRMTTEWIAAIDRDSSHPSIVTWVPLNESWGVQHIGSDERMQHYARGLAELTRALDPTRLVVTNDGWEHLDSDLLTIHDYEPDGDVLAERYGSTDAIDRVLGGVGPAGRRVRLGPPSNPGTPVLVTEFGGISFVGAESVDDDAWGYSSATDGADFERRLRAVLDAVNRSESLAGWVYTQLTDTAQETNGLTDENRVPKLPVEVIRSLVLGTRG